MTHFNIPYFLSFYVQVFFAYIWIFTMVFISSASLVGYAACRGNQSSSLYDAVPASITRGRAPKY